MKAEREAYSKVIRMISHEVNNTMTSVGSIMETVGDELKEKNDTEELCAALQACVTRSREMSTFITRFANVVKIPEPQLLPTSLNALVTANQQFLESLCSVHDIRLDINLCEQPAPVADMDMPLMTQVLVNIVKNSIESILEKGGNDGRITISTHNTSLNTKHSTLNTVSTLTVTDNGAGISAETEKHLFTPFFSTKPNGHGIGLLLIREILTRHHCRFSLRSDSGGTTTFRIEFAGKENDTYK